MSKSRKWRGRQREGEAYLLVVEGGGEADVGDEVVEAAGAGAPQGQGLLVLHGDELLLLLLLFLVVVGLHLLAVLLLLVVAGGLPEKGGVRVMAGRGEGRGRGGVAAGEGSPGCSLTAEAGGRLLWWRQVAVLVLEPPPSTCERASGGLGFMEGERDGRGRRRTCVWEAVAGGPASGGGGGRSGERRGRVVLPRSGA